MYTDILYEVENSIGRITINRPKVMNAWRKNTKEEIVDALKKAGKDTKVKVVIITGLGDKSFCSGQDLKESKEIEADKADKWITDFDLVYWTIRHFEKLLIAAVNGIALGSGWDLALLCDFRIASENARFAYTEIDVGFACILGITILWNTLGESLTKELVLTGKFINAEDALRLHLVNKVVTHKDFRKVVDDFAGELTNKAPIATKLNKQWFCRLTDQAYLDSISFAKEAFTIEYASGEPQKYQNKFFNKKKKSRNK